MLFGRIIGFNNPELFSTGNECTDYDGPRSVDVDLVNTEKAEWIRMVTAYDEVRI